MYKHISLTPVARPDYLKKEISYSEARMITHSDVEDYVHATYEHNQRIEAHNKVNRNILRIHQKEINQFARNFEISNSKLTDLAKEHLPQLPYAEVELPMSISFTHEGIDQVLHIMPFVRIDDYWKDFEMVRDSIHAMLTLEARVRKALIFWLHQHGQLESLMMSSHNEREFLQKADAMARKWFTDCTPPADGDWVVGGNALFGYHWEKQVATSDIK